MKTKAIVKIGIVGCGAIGSSLAKIISRDFRRGARLAAVYDLDSSKAYGLSARLGLRSSLVVPTLDALIGVSDLVIEAASAHSSWNIARSVIARRKDLLLLSVGGIAAHYDALVAGARRNNVRVYIPSGAISGLDALKASMLGGVKKVQLTTRKHPRSFAGNLYLKSRGMDLAGMKKETLLYCGSALKAIRYFPQNINVAALLAVAGVGLEDTRVKIIADPAVHNNIHELEIVSGAGSVVTRTQNVLHPDNPKTSYMAVLSAAAMLKQILHPVRVGT